MRLFEFEAKNILQKYGITIPRGKATNNPEEAAAITRELGKPVALKAQILVASRGKAGGIIFARDAAEARKVAAKLIDSNIQGNLVGSLLVEEKLSIAEQFYASVAIDRQAKTYVVLASTEGGVDIEQTVQARPDSISRYRVDTDAGFNQPAALNLLSKFSLNQNDAGTFAAVLSTLYTVAIDNDAELVEVNPLVRTASGELIAADAKIIIDDNALFRHPEFGDKSLVRVDDTPLEAEARRQNLAYVDLDGDIGIVGNGAGLTMATLDLVYHFGGRPANFLDIGSGGNNVDIIKTGLSLVMSKPEVKAVIVNILGGIMRCDIVAQALIQALNEASVKKPVVVRMIGTNEAEGSQMLRQAGIHTYANMEEAVQKILKL